MQIIYKKLKRYQKILRILLLNSMQLLFDQYSEQIPEDSQITASKLKFLQITVSDEHLLDFKSVQDFLEASKTDNVIESIHNKLISIKYQNIIKINQYT